MLRRAFGLIHFTGTDTLLLAGCTSDGHFSLLGYTTAPNYDTSIRTVYVPIFGNQTFRQGID